MALNPVVFALGNLELHADTTSTTIAAALRIAFGLALLLTTGWLGYAHRHAWVVLPLGTPFMVLYVAGKWPAWRMLWRVSGWRSVAKGLAATAIVQGFVAGIFYVLGVGVGRGYWAAV